ncbi:MAG: aminotransferase class V-fold PLP-dependent enzyme [Bacteroidota bacterium]
MSDNGDLARARSLFPHTAQGKVYLNHAGTGPLSTAVVGAVGGYLRERSEGRIETYGEDLRMLAEVKNLVARLIGAESPGRIALTPSTSDALNIVAAGIPWREGDTVLVNTAEFPANVWPWLNLGRLGVRAVFLPCPDGRITIDRVLDSLTPRTRVVALSAVQYLSGYRADLATIGEICRSRGIIFVVDAIQAVGAVCLHVQRMKIDALAAGGQKWQMAPHGTGFLYITEELQSILQQKSVGWLGVQDPWDFHNFAQDLAPDARRYEGGSPSIPALWGMRAALTTLLEFGPDRVERRVLDLAGTLRGHLSGLGGVTVATPAEAAERAGIVTVRLPGRTDLASVFKDLVHDRILPAMRDEMLRFSPHFYCTEEEMHSAAEALRQALLRHTHEGPRPFIPS